MLTNKIKVDYNMENIAEDFDIYKVEKANKDYYKHNILDSAVYEFKAAAVQWTFGATALVLFRKGEVNEKGFKESIMKEYEDVRIQKIDVLDSGQCASCFYHENRLLAQLLINSMRTPKHAAFQYNNLTGKLLYQDPSWKHKNIIRFLEIVIDPGMYLNLEHKTYKRYDGVSNGLYVIDPKTGQFRKKLKNDTKLITYKEGSLQNKRLTVDNFNITDISCFKKSKMGVMERFLRDVKEHLSKYMSIELVEREEAEAYNISTLEKKGISELEYGEMLQKRGVVIVNESNSETSRNLVERVKEDLKKFYYIEATEGELSKEAYNIRIIHNSEYYIENEMSDPYMENLNEYIVQHMTEEIEHFANAKGGSPSVKKIVQELIIKGEVRECLLSIFDWKRLDSGKAWVFVLRKKTKELAYKYYRLRIDCDGRLEFDSFCDYCQDENDDWEKICYAYDTVKSRHRGSQNQVEGLLYSDIDNIHAIILTKEKTLPNIAALMDALTETDVKEKVSTEDLLEAIKAFETKYPEYGVFSADWCYQLSQEAGMITKKTVKKILNMRTNAASLFNRFLHEKYGIWIDGEIRKEEFEPTFQIGNLLNIKYEYNENDYLDGNAFVYYVGAKSKRQSYPNACCMRKVISLGEKIEFEELLPLMAVEFVRNSQYTVLPFPYKYLREYIAMEE